MFYAYVLKSLSTDFYYKGHCSDLSRRLAQHNAGMTRSIRKYTPFKIAYFEEFENRDEAVKRETFQVSCGRKFLKENQIFAYSVTIYHEYKARRSTKYHLRRAVF